MLATAQELTDQNCFKIKMITFLQQLFKKITVSHPAPQEQGARLETCSVVESSLVEQPFAKQTDINWTLYWRKIQLQKWDNPGLEWKLVGISLQSTQASNHCYLPEKNYFTKNIFLKKVREGGKSEESGLKHQIHLVAGFNLGVLNRLKNSSLLQGVDFIQRETL